MHVEEIRLYALQKENATEGFPFGEDTLVFKTNNKIFLLVSLDNADLRLNVKAEPDKAIEQREEYPVNIVPGYHMNKKHWNTIIIAGLKTKLLMQLIDDSYNLVAKKKK